MTKASKPVMEIITQNQKNTRLYGFKCDEKVDPNLTIWDLPSESVKDITIGGQSGWRAVIDLDLIDYVVVNGYITLRI